MAELGLEEADLTESVQEGLSAWAASTPNHPPAAPGYFAWAETVRALRDRLTLKGWGRLNEANLPLVINENKDVAIAVSTGSRCTGLKEGNPSTSSTKGPMTSGAIQSNRQQLLFSEQEMLRSGAIIKLDNNRQLFPDAELLSEPSDQTLDIFGRSTWILLMYRDKEEARCELSCPVGMTEEGYVDEWKERIILNPTRFDGLEPRRKTEFDEPSGGSSPEIVVEIKKRA